MARKPKRQVKRWPGRKGPLHSALRLASDKKNRVDSLDAFVAAAARALDLPVERAWLPAIKANLAVTLQHAATVTAFRLSDDIQPAPVFRA